ncbi:MAG: DUF58 domain-containing protein [Planctomycetota bacterium]
MAANSNYLDPKTLNKVASLELKARKVVEGTLSGMHRSPYRGFSIEFAEHREYVPGDELRHLDWKVYGRSDRFYIKQYEEETNLRAMLCVDLSKSMRLAGAPAAGPARRRRHGAVRPGGRAAAAVELQPVATCATSWSCWRRRRPGPPPTSAPRCTISPTSSRAAA